jgi:hypothetical protein
LIDFGSGEDTVYAILTIYHDEVAANCEKIITE